MPSSKTKNLYLAPTVVSTSPKQLPPSNEQRKLRSGENVFFFHKEPGGNPASIDIGNLNAEPRSPSPSFDNCFNGKLTSDQTGLVKFFCNKKTWLVTVAIALAVVFLVFWLIGDWTGIGWTNTSNKSQNVTKTKTAGPDSCTTESCLAVAERIRTDMGDVNDLNAACHDFYQFACGGFLEHDRSAVVNTRSTGDIIKQQLRQILLEEKPYDTAKTMPVVTYKVRKFFKSCVKSKQDQEYEEGLAAMRRMVADLGGFWPGGAFKPFNWPTGQQWSLTKVIATLHSKYSMQALFTSGVSRHLQNNSRAVIYLGQPSSVMEPDEMMIPVDQYLYCATLTSPEQHHASLSSEDVRGFLQLRESFESLEQPKTNDLNDTSYLKYVDVAWLKANLSIIDWRMYFQVIFREANLPLSYVIDDKMPIILQGVGYFGTLQKKLAAPKNANKRNKDLHNYLVFRAVFHYWKDFVSKHLQEDGAFIDDDDADVIDICLDDTLEALDVPLGVLFIDWNFEWLNRTKERVSEIVRNVVGTYRISINTSSWMDSETKRAALAKLDAIEWHVAFEPWMRNESLVLAYHLQHDFTNDFAANLLEAYRQEFIITNFQALVNSHQRMSFLVPASGATSIYARYSSLANKIYLAAAFLANPFYHNFAEDIPDAVYYGSIGSTIGHEITHAFDPDCRRYDKDGHFTAWWLNNKTLRAMQAKELCFIKQFNGYEIVKDQVDGWRTLAENLADTGGLIVAYQAFKTTLHQKQLSEIRQSDNFQLGINGINLTLNQLFFLSYAQDFCSANNNDYSYLTSEHAPDKWRVQGALMNSDDFARAYNCSINTKKCIIW